MYTILVNKDLSLTTSVKTTLLRNTTTDEIWFLWKSPTSDASENTEETRTDVLEEEVTNPSITTEIRYTALLRYETDNVMKTDSLISDEEPYKGRERFILPRSSSFFNNRGMVQLWLEIVTETITTTITYDEETGEVISETTETKTETFTTLPTTLFIEEVPHNKPWHHRDDNVIRITRGDSLTVTITLTDSDGFPYEPVEGDTVLFTVKKSAKADTVLIQKQIDINTLVLDLVESDTENLAFGEYKYEVEVITEADDHYTVIKNAPFIITEELH